MWDPYTEFEFLTLPNGLNIYAAHWPGRTWETVGFLIHSGASQDPVGFEGLSHFVEHAVSDNVDGKKMDIKAFFLDCGGSVNLGRTGYFDTDYKFFLPADREIVAKAFNIFGQMLLSAKLGNLIENERQVIIREFRRTYPLEFRLELCKRERRVLHSGCWLERFLRPFGNPESVEKIMPNHLQSYYDAHYTPANISIVGVGGMQPLEIFRLLAESPFAIGKSGTRTPISVSAKDINLPLENRYVFEISKHAKMEVPVEHGAYESIAKIPGSFNECVIRIMSEMLNEDLNEEVREKRAWTYHIGSFRSNFRNFYEFSINCDSLAAEAIPDIENVIESCIDSMGKREDLFEQSKGRILASNFMLDPTGKGIRDCVLEDISEFHRIISLVEYAENIKRVTIKDIQNLLLWLRPERRWTLLTKP